ncbi:MAG: HupE/UreJ family protein [Candidatus Berkiellales bacterium]
MIKNNSTIAFFVFLLFIFPELALAHPNHFELLDITSGLWHPLTGWDHCLTMMAVGVLSYVKNTKWIWIYPLCFICSMIVGSLFGYAALMIPWFELGITFSVLILGLCLSFPHHITSLSLFIAIAAFAFCHGFAHGYEITEALSFLPYMIGFTLTTAFLLLLGILIGKILSARLTWLLQIAGCAMALSAFWL